MKKPPEPQLKRDLTKLAFLTAAAAGFAAIFAVNPALSTPTFLALVISMVLSPWVCALERRGLSRSTSIALVFGAIFAVIGSLGFWAASNFMTEWGTLKLKGPGQFRAAMLEFRSLEEGIKILYPFLDSLHPTDTVVSWGQNAGKWAAENGAGIVASILTWILVVPPLTFVLLNEGRAMRRRFFHLVPNRLFESFFLISNQITNSISDYLRAKLVEAFLVGTMTTIGLLAVKAPYAFVLGIIAGLTNILPYIGPVMGAAPALLIVFFDRSGHALTFPVLMVYLMVNLVDTIVIFPLVVAKLVKLHPLLLIAVVAIGQQYYGLVGMLVSIPIATACKVILTEIHSAIYEQRSARRAETAVDSATLEERAA